MNDRLRRLFEQYKPLAETTPVAEFCRQVLMDGTGKIDTAFLLRELYGMSLLDCKLNIEMAHDHLRLDGRKFDNPMFPF